MVNIINNSTDLIIIDEIVVFIPQHTIYIYEYSSLLIF